MVPVDTQKKDPWGAYYMNPFLGKSLGIIKVSHFGSLFGSLQSCQVKILGMDPELFPKVEAFQKEVPRE